MYCSPRWSLFSWYSELFKTRTIRHTVPRNARIARLYFRRVVQFSGWSNISGLSLYSSNVTMFNISIYPLLANHFYLMQQHVSPFAAMGGNLRLFRVLMWKNFLLLRKKRVMVVMMTLVPACFSLVLLYVRTQVSMTVKTVPLAWRPRNPTTICRTHTVSVLHLRRRSTQIYFAPDTDIVRKIMNLTGKEHLFSK